MEALDNLVKIRRLKVEPPDAREFDGMLRVADLKLKDACIEGLSEDSQFSLAYSAAHALSLAAIARRAPLARLPLRKPVHCISVLAAHGRFTKCKMAGAG